MTDPRKDLPPASASNFNEKLREAVQTYLGNRGDKLDRGVTLRDLVDSGLIQLGAGYMAGGGGLPIGGPGPNAGGQDAPADLTPPPTPTGFNASAAFTNIFLGHDAPLYIQGKGHDRTVVYGATWLAGDKPTFDKAVELTTFQGVIASYPTNPATTWHLWIKWQSKDGVLSSAPAGGTNGVEVTTGQNVDLLVKTLTGPGKPFTVLNVDTVIDGVTFPAGTYSTRAFISDLQVTNAKIANLAVDNAKIASLSVSKLTAGAISAGDITSTGTTVVNGTAVPSWSVNGSTGLASFNNVTVRGTVFASAGSFTGSIFADSGYFRGSVNTGSFTGYAWPATGGGSHLSSQGLLLGNFHTGKYFQVTGAGDVYTPNLTIIGNSARFTGSVAADTLETNGGRFTVNADGTVVADTVNIKRRIVLQNGSFDPTEVIYGADGGGASLPPGTVFTGEINAVILSDIYNAAAMSSSANQPYYVAAMAEGAFRNWAGSTNALFSFQVFASPSVSRTFSNAGNYPDDHRLSIKLSFKIVLLSGTFIQFRLPVLQWTIFQL